MVNNAWHREWSSAQTHISDCDSSGLLDMEFWKKRFNPKEWKVYLEQTADDEAIAKKIRYATMKGLLFGSKATAIRLEWELGVQLREKKRGPKVKVAPLH